MFAGMLISSTAISQVCGSFSAVSMGYSHAAAVRSDGTLWTWGNNIYGALGNGTTTNSSVPIQIGTSTNWSKVSAGNNFTIALKTDGTLWAWGLNISGELGIGGGANQLSPVQVGTATNWSMIDCGSNFTLARKTDGTLWSWGINGNGQLGIGSIMPSNVPVQIGSSTWITFSAGYSHAVGIQSNGTLWTWGANSSGQLGLGNTTSVSVPVQISASTSWTMVAGGGDHTLAYRSDATIWACGNNSNGQIGNNSTTNALSLVQVFGGITISKISAAFSASYAISSSGSLYVWGNNASGQLGDGTTISKLSPISNPVTGWSTSNFDGGGSSYIGTRTNLLFTGGSNLLGQLGNGNTTNATNPTQISFNAPANPTATSPISYLQNATASALTATGTNLKWYTASTGGTGTTTAPTPSTATVGTTSYYVSQTIGCEGSRSTINVMVGQPGTHLDFDGVNDFISSTNSTTYNNFTIEFWANPTGTTTLATQANTGVTGNSGTHRYAVFPVQGTTTYGNGVSGAGITVGTNGICVYEHAASYLPSLLTYSGNITGWTHIALVYSNKQPLLYINGNLVATGLISNFAQVAMSTSSIGGGQYGYFMGGLDEIRFWNTALSQLDIKRRMNCEVSPSETNLNSYFKLNQGIGGAGNAGLTSVTDAGPSNRTSTATNFTLVGSTSNWVSGSPIVTGTSIPFSPIVSAQTFCNTTSFLVNNLTPAPSSTTYWFSSNTGGTPLTGTTTLTTGTYYAAYVNSSGCYSPLAPTSVTVNSPVTPSVTLASSSNSNCPGSTIVFTATPTNGGNSPTYAFSVNGTVVQSSTSSTYSSSSLVSGDVVTVSMTSNYTCLTSPAAVTSNTITLNISAANCGDATLSRIELSVGAINEILSANNFSYTAQVGSNISTIRVKPTLSNSSGSIQVRVNGGSYSSVTNTTFSNPLTLTNASLIEILVTSGNGTTKTYTIDLQKYGCTAVVKAALGYQHSMHILAGGTLYGMGGNTYGQLGLSNTTVNYPAPVRIDTSTNWVEVATRNLSSLGIKNNGTLWAWGRNANGQLGIGNTTDQAIPVQVGTATNWAKVACGAIFSVALKTDGTLWTWGDNATGQLGNGTTTSSSTPIQVGNSTWLQIAAADGGVYAIRSDSTLWAWGLNTSNQLGNGNATNSLVPIQISSEKWITIGSGPNNGGAIKSNGTLWTWGVNGNNQVGNGTSSNHSTPAQIGGFTNWKSISFGLNHGIASRADGTLYAWGSNANGNFGNGTTTNSSTPIQIGAPTIDQVFGGIFTSAVRRFDGSYYTMGYNSNGQIGNNQVGVNAVNQTPIINSGTPLSTINQYFYTVGASAIPLVGSGSNVLWYTTPSGGVGSSTAPVPSTASLGTTNYYVTANNGACESPRQKVEVNVMPTANSLDFDGTNDYISATQQTTVKNNFSVEFWVKPTATTTLPTQANSGVTGNSGAQRTVIFPVQGGTTFGAGNSGAGITVGTNGIAVFEHSDNYLPALLVYNGTLTGWNHVALVYTNKQPSIYLNGNLVATGLTSNMNNVYQSNGSIGGGSFGYFQGGLDDIRFWNYSLSPSDINARMNCELIGNESGLQGYYKLNQGVSAQNNPFVINATASSTYSTGTLNNFALTGPTSNWMTSSPVVSGSSIPSAPSNSSASYCGTTLLSSVTNPPSATTRWYATATSTYVLPGVTAVTSTKTYYVASVNANGCESARTPITITINPIPTTPTTTSTTINYALNATATALSATGTGLSWFTTPSGGIGSPTAPTPSTSTVGTTVYYVASTASSCVSPRLAITVNVALLADNLNFDGVNDYVQLPQLAFNNLSSGTIETWVKLSNLSNQTILSKQSNNVNSYGILIVGGLNATPGKVHYQSVNFNSIVSNTTLTTGQWYHIAISFTPSSASMYINGVLDATSSASFSLPSDSNNTIPTIGAWLGDGGGRYFTGQMDEFRIWNVARTGTQIAANRNCELNGNESGLVTYYKFNHGFHSLTNTITALANSSSNGIAHNANLNNFGLTGTTSNWVNGSTVNTGITIPSVPTASAQQFCGSATVDSLLPARSATINWYAAATGGTALTGSTVLTSSTYYVAAANANGCESARVPVSVLVNTGVTPSISITASDTSVCVGMPIQFTASLTNKGTAPIINFYIDNVLEQSGSSNTFTTTSYSNNSIVTATLTTNIACVTARTVSSNGIQIRNNPTICANAKLLNLKSNTGIWETRYNRLDTSYSIIVGNSTTSIRFTPTVVVAGSTIQIRINGGNYTSINSGSQSASLPLNIGHNQVDFLVTASNGVNTQLYTVLVTRPTCEQFAQVATGINHTLALKSDGTLWASGDNTNGQLGNGTTSSTNSLIQVGTANDWASINSFGNSNIAIKTDGSIWSWGNNSMSQLGLGTTSNTSTPTQIAIATNWTQVSIADDHGLGVKENGTLWAWGSNSNNQLGISGLGMMGIPVQVGTENNWTYAHTSTNFSVALKQDSSLWIWGLNTSGQLGLGNSTATLEPARLGSANDWVKVISKPNGFFAIKADGTLWAWGSNGQYQLGNGSNVAVSTPIQIGTDTDWKSISASSNFTLAVKTNGSIWSWGTGNSGQLGLSSTNQQVVPTQIGLNPEFVSVSAGENTAAFVKKNGTIWITGSNANGTFGTGNSTSSNSIIQFGGNSGSLPSGSVAITANFSSGQALALAGSCSPIATVYSTGNSPVFGTMNAKEWVETITPKNFIRRHYELTPDSNSHTATARITLYYSQADFDTFNLTHSIKLPTSSSDATGISNLLIEKRGGVSTDGSGLPDSYVGSIQNIDPSDSDIVWNQTQNRWEVSFTVVGFSGFFVKTQNIQLPVDLISFSGKVINKQGQLQWITANEKSFNRFEIERSVNGINFQKIGEVSAKGGSSQNFYSFTDINLTGSMYYRLKMVDNDGSFKYSSLIRLNLGESPSLQLFPIPAMDQLNVSGIQAGGMLKVIDMSGKTIQQLITTQTTEILMIDQLPSGIYLLEYINQKGESTKMKWIKY